MSCDDGCIALYTWVLSTFLVVPWFVGLMHYYICGEYWKCGCAWLSLWLIGVVYESLWIPMYTSGGDFQFVGVMVCGGV